MTEPKPPREERPSPASGVPPEIGTSAETGTSADTGVDAPAPVADARPARSVRSMARALVPLVVIVVIAVVLFTPRGSEDTRRADVGGDLDYAAKITGFALARPRGLDASWRAVSSAVAAPHTGATGPVTVTVTYLSPDRVAVDYAVSSGTRQTLLGNELGAAAASGSVRVGDRDWQQLNATDGRTAITTTVGRSVVLIAGKGDRTALVLLAAAVS